MRSVKMEGDVDEELQQQQQQTGNATSTAWTDEMEESLMPTHEECANLRSVLRMCVRWVLLAGGGCGVGASRLMSSDIYLSFVCNHHAGSTNEAWLRKLSLLKPESQISRKRWHRRMPCCRCPPCR